MSKERIFAKGFYELNTYEPKQQETFVPDALQDDPLF
jgi:hypothetical protein